MAENRNRNRNFSRAYGTGYIGDNLARSIAPAAEPLKAPEKEPVREPERKAQPKEQPERGLCASFGFAFTLLMVGAAVVLFITLAKYISLNIDAGQKAKEIASLRSQLTTAVMENDNYEVAINASIDYDYIYQVATQELGMVYASKSQIITYEHKESEYVVQYKDVE